MVDIASILKILGPAAGAVGIAAIPLLFSFFGGKSDDRKNEKDHENEEFLRKKVDEERRKNRALLKKMETMADGDDKLMQMQKQLNSKLEKSQKEIKMLAKNLETTDADRRDLEKKLKHASTKLQYNITFPIPEFLQEHQEKNPDSFYIQIVGCRGVGKSTFINYILKELGKTATAVSDVVEATLKPSFYDITSGINHKPDNVKNVFLVDMPGMGGLKITRAGYFRKFGPGHFDMTLIMAQNGLNEDEKFIMLHLVENKRKLYFIRSKTDSDIMGIMDEKDVTKAEAFQKIKTTTNKYIKDNLRSNVSTFYTGLPRKETCSKTMVHHIISG